jgi:hypothetical protein
MYAFSVAGFVTLGLVKNDEKLSFIFEQGAVVASHFVFVCLFFSFFCCPPPISILAFRGGSKMVPVPDSVLMCLAVSYGEFRSSE